MHIDFVRLLLAASLLLSAAKTTAAQLRSGEWSLQLPAGCEAKAVPVPANPLYSDEDRKALAQDPRATLKPGFNNMPAHLRVDLSACYTHTPQFSEPELYLIPVETYLRIYDKSDNEQEPALLTDYTRLQRWLQDGPDSQARWPFLPFLDMSPQFTVQRRALNFHGGRGIRLITMFVNDVGLAQSGMLTYIFQGLTDDGSHYVLLMVPMALPGLAAEADEEHLGFSIEQLDGNLALGARYETAVGELLQKQQAQLRPSTATLDALVQSLRRTKSATPAPARP